MQDDEGLGKWARLVHLRTNEQLGLDKEVGTYLDNRVLRKVKGKALMMRRV